MWECPVKTGVTIRREDNIQGTPNVYLLYLANLPQTLIIDPSSFSLVFQGSLEPTGLLLDGKSAHTEVIKSS